MLSELRKKLKDQQETLNAAQTRYVTAFDAQEKRHAQALGALNADLTASVELQGHLSDEVIRLENHLLNLRSQAEAAKRQQREALDAREEAWRKDDEAIETKNGRMSGMFGRCWPRLTGYGEQGAKS